MQNHRKLWWFYKLIPVKLPHEKWKLNKENLSSKNIELTLRRKQENPLSIKDLIEGVAEPELSALLFGLEPKSNFFSQLRLLLFLLKNRRYYTGITVFTKLLLHPQCWRMRVQVVTMCSFYLVLNSFPIRYDWAEGKSGVYTFYPGENMIMCQWKSRGVKIKKI